MPSEAGESLIGPLTKTPGKDLGELGVVSLILSAIKYPDYSVRNYLSRSCLHTISYVLVIYWIEDVDDILR